ncbi:MAG: UDP-N-acetylglucosamine--N-acetylmuramyl-(pentapeptide) pyrophosphoryl-undecaprenol N-acetylglucosamine transferase [Anaerolineae bacterium]
MRIMIAAGGTGGHVYPALAVAEALASPPSPLSIHGEREQETTLYFVGSTGGFERPLVDEAVKESGLKFAAYDEVRAGPLHGVPLLQIPVSVVNLIIGFVQSLLLIVRHKPRALLLTGGWVNVPVALAAWLLRVPSLIYLPDIEPGLTIKVLRPFARKVAVTTDESRAFIPEKQMVVTGYPLRRAVLEAANKREQALARFSLNPAKKTLLVFGGSRGARSINMALLDILPQLLSDGVQVVHATGTLDWERVEQQKQTLGNPPDYHAYPYIHDMGMAFTAADIVLCRSGASTLGELPLFGLPSILVPYPHAWRYQKVNAEYLSQRGAGLLMEDAKMGTELLPTLRDLLSDADKLAQMAAKARTLARPDGARCVGDELLRLGGAE